MKTILKNIGKVVLGIGLAVFSVTAARAVWDSTTGNMPNFYRLCWGLDQDACIYGSSVSNYVRIQTGGTDAITIDSAQAVTLSGALTVTGAVTVPDDTITTAKIAADSVTNPKILTGAVDTSKIASDSVTTVKIMIDKAGSKVACVTSQKRLGTCSDAPNTIGNCTCS